MQEHWAEVRYEAEMDRRRESLQRRMQAYFVPVVSVLVAVLIIGTRVMLAFSPPDSPMQLVPLSAGVLPEPEPVETVPEPSRSLKLLASLDMHNASCFSKARCTERTVTKCFELSRPQCIASTMCTLVAVSENVDEDEAPAQAGR